MNRLLRTCSITAVVVAMLLPAAAAAAAPPDNPAGERFLVDETGPSFFTEICGFEVIEHTSGHMRLRELDPERNGRLFQGNFALTVTLTGVESQNSVVFQDRGADRVRLLPDGSEELVIIGRSLPWGSIGRLVLVDDEFVSAAGRPVDADAICAQLAP